MFRRKIHGNEASENGGELCTLIELAEGEKGVVVKALGGFILVRRLAEMGLTPGVEVRLVKKGSFGGPVEVEVRGVALALGRSIASKVLVKPVKDEPHD
ncbi:MAG: FeoA family protein [Nitrososphaerota archaeon]|nr:ferrous iron transport protein A [Candidatus Bathyarchaeota archaeon]MDW8024055.1 FeoA family protein [Nitrososphaerota archaeon]MDW8040552.1 FeoA family protein [Nitrososphaerota archaeon]